MKKLNPDVNQIGCTAKRSSNLANDEFTQLEEILAFQHYAEQENPDERL